MDYTKEPWILEAGRSFKTVSGDFYITYGKDKNGKPNFKNFVELDNNARLISACPDMYEALKYVVAWHREHDSGEGELFGLDFVTSCISAIHKAEGRG